MYIFLSEYIMYKLGLYMDSLTEIGLKISNLKKKLMKIVKLTTLQTLRVGVLRTRR